MRFTRDPFVVERRYRLEPSLLRPGAAPDVTEQTLLVPLRAVRGDVGPSLIFLSDVTERMWALLTQGSDTDAIADAIAREYDVDADRARADLAKLADDLVARGALVREQ
jgi:hypothetical protein